MPGKLFTRDFLNQGIRETAAGHALDGQRGLGCYRTRLLVLESMQAVAAGDLETVVAG